MKRLDLFCSSPASTTICSSIDQHSMVRRSHRAPTTTATAASDHQSSPARLLHNRLKNVQPHVPCSSQLPINPKPYNNNYDQKSRKSCSSNYNYSKQTELRRKSSADIYDLKGPPSTGSSRYLLSDDSSSAPFIDWLSEADAHKRHVVPAEPAAKYRSLSSKDSPALKTSSSTRSRHQVVVLRVSLHCKGCEGKVKKHLSKMEGVTSFSIDLASKKVTVIGDVTPLGVLASVSKVKNAQLWPSTTSSPSSPWSA
ncbi:Heavy metal-associated domain containing protein [Parasponia andersonii]|uniref:Heavy metal-associated domain containing protein n=1 Tax=Parasponia andersonii TaxID=3476 RepID=A0A2P5D189_PARAD|nr:Heavy metal-associated domain containing protein [Parasponia andersonii]